MNDTDARRRNHWVSHIARHAHEKPGGVYLRFEGGSVTWAQIHERVSGLAAALRERGVTTFLSHASLPLDERRRAEQAFADMKAGRVIRTVIEL